MRWIVVGASALYAAWLVYWFSILLRGGWGAVVAKLENREAARVQSVTTRTPLRENIMLAFVALLVLGVFVVPLLLRQH
ncbi:MAG TPA: hypothetical protein VL899_13190 [Alphaproteobacteria bacterium]|nr:hypothetical protein [Alphaproteobacteria bacterium]